MRLKQNYKDNAGYVVSGKQSISAKERIDETQEKICIFNASAAWAHA